MLRPETAAARSPWSRIARVRELAREFLDASGIAGAVEDDTVDARLRVLFDEARTSFPAIVVDPCAFVRYLGERAKPQLPALASMAELRSNDLYVACACVHGDLNGMATFEHDYLRPAGAAVARSGADRQDVDDALQLLREKLLVAGGRLREYSGRGSLAGWVRVSLARQLASVQRSRRRRVPLEPNAADQLAASDPDLAMIRRRYGDVFQSAFQDAFRGLTPAQRNVLRLNFVDGLNLDRIAVILKVSRATVGRRVLEARTALLDTMLALLGERLRASPSEIESLLAVVRSTLYGSLAELLQSTTSAKQP
jgi:RNA polymerase sigma-70 factor (ECF subfamily)